MNNTNGNLQQLRHVAIVVSSNVDKKSLSDEWPVRLCNYVDVRRHRRIHAGMNFMHATATGAEREHFQVGMGDVIITKDSGNWTHIGMPALVVSEAPDLLCAYGLAILRPRPREVLGGFLAFALQVPEIVGQFHRSATGVTFHHLSLGAIRSALVPTPPLDTQRLVIRYLDHAELCIAKAIAAKQRMLALLDEREELALLSAITQSNRPMTTDSRLDWLGEFPAHWGVQRLGSLLEERGEMNHDRRVQQVLSLVRKRGVLRYEDKGRIGNKRSDDVARYKVVREGDIVLNSMNVIIGSVGQSAYTGCLSPVYYVLKPRSSEHHNAYFNALFQVERFHSSLVRFGKGILAHRMRIPMIDLKTVMLPVPPADEQLAISERVVKATANLKASRAGVEKEIALLKEYRIRLISDVVTGKMDVTNEAAKLPDIDPVELAEALAGVTAGSSDEVEDEDGGDDEDE